MTELKINGATHTLDLPPDMPLLWALRDHLGLTGTKFGCGKALCGACTVHVDGYPLRACVTTVGSVQGRAVTTIEGVDQDPVGRRVQAAWEAHRVPQCGYCQPGQVMSATALLKTHPHPSEAQLEQAMGGNICRCGTYPRIRAAIADAAKGEAA